MWDLSGTTSPFKLSTQDIVDVVNEPLGSRDASCWCGERNQRRFELYQSLTQIPKLWLFLTFISIVISMFLDAASLYQNASPPATPEIQKQPASGPLY